MQRVSFALVGADGNRRDGPGRARPFRSVATCVVDRKWRIRARSAVWFYT